MGWLPEGPMLAADYCVCESTKIAGIKPSCCLDHGGLCRSSLGESEGV